VSERFLVTGAYGCIGAWVVRQLVDEGVAVIAADASTEDRRVRALLDADELSRVRFVQGDISRPEDVDALFDLRPTHVIHLAALQVPFCRADPVRGAQVNVVGTVAIFTAAMQAGLKTPIVYASSAAAYAAADAGLDPSGHPATHYGVYKLANEETARVFAAENSISSIGLRPYVVYGPGRDQGLTSAPTLAMRAAAQGEPYTIGYSGVSQLQYGADAAAAFVAAARVSYDGATVVNLPGVTASIDEIVEEIVRVEPDARIDVDGAPLPFPPELDTSAFAEIVGDVQITPLADGVAATIAHFR
jgi:UDP-glucuronate 4-epimerase